MCLCVFCVKVFVELNELVIDRNQELQWRETARWIKFEEELDEETERWGKPHIASLTFRSLLELRKTISHGKRALCCPHQEEDDNKLVGKVAHFSTQKNIRG